MKTKTKTLIVAAISLATTALSQAFSIDFSALTPALKPVGTVNFNIAGYGDVTISQVGTETSVATTSGLYVNPGATVLVQFIPTTAGNYPQSVVVSGSDISTVALGAVDATNFYNISAPNGISTTVGVVSDISWDVVPEPSSAILGIIGMGLIVLRRHR